MLKSDSSSKICFEEEIIKFFFKYVIIQSSSVEDVSRTAFPDLPIIPANKQRVSSFKNQKGKLQNRAVLK